MSHEEFYKPPEIAGKAYPYTGYADTLDEPTIHIPGIERPGWISPKFDLTLVFGNDDRLMSFRRLALTERGHQCLLFPSTRQGDAVAIAHGCSVPLILREESGGRYCFIGEAFVKGMMKGECVDWAEAEGDEFMLV